ncbi:hypothetical protein TCDM_02004 [Trypanosoma cruzi Dm28c]|uniref:Uncharacterized protein n=1 Tax=Trypanosoma cruzi Dm28c TaxID=1416333 RepID=V5DP93_TRYCR|nr:hypothetical protein TCDM_02004 [Trypanosoma cruzi Dm28c]
MFHCYYNSSLTSPLFVFCIYSFFFFVSFFYPHFRLYLFSLFYSTGLLHAVPAGIYIYIYIYISSLVLHVCVCVCSFNFLYSGSTVPSVVVVFLFFLCLFIYFYTSLHVFIIY